MPSALTTNINSRNLPEAGPPAKVPSDGPNGPGSKPVLAQVKADPKPPRKTSKPIINWLQRKLAGTVKAKRQDLPPPPTTNLKGRNPITHSKVTNRVVSSPLPSSKQKRPQTRTNVQSSEEARQKTVSLNGDEHHSMTSHERSSSEDGSYMAQESLWSPASAVEADDDASLRPLPPSIPPSPSPSPSSSSYLSDPRTFRSIAASTKPTTVLSVDLNGNGMAHIAQAPLTPSSAPNMNRFASHGRTSSTTTNPNVTFSALPPSPQSSRPSSVQSRSAPLNTPIPAVQAPLHTTHHPRNNPRPSSPPLDNASVLTLASSAFAMPGFRGNNPGWGSAPPSAMGAGDSASHFDDSVLYDVENSSHLDGDTLDERDFDASVRALRPRSSRRGSWESEASRWSARIQGGPGTPVTRERSVWTTNSIRTGAPSLENAVESEKDGALELDGTAGTPGPLEVQLPESSVEDLHGIAENHDLEFHPSAVLMGEKDQATPVQERDFPQT
jgi:hypothetical protein